MLPGVGFWLEAGKPRSERCAAVSGISLRVSFGFKSGRRAMRMLMMKTNWMVEYR